MKKFIISIISTVLILASMTNITVSQAATCSASLSGATVTEETNVTITIAFSQPVRTAGFNLKYDNTKLQFDSSSVALSSEPNGSKKVAYVSMNGSAPIQSISFTFKTSGTGTVDVTASNIEVSVRTNDPKKDEAIDVESVSSVVTINSKPKDSDNTEKPGTDTNKPGTNTNTNKPGTNTNTNKPSTSTNTNKPSTSTNTNKPSTNTATKPNNNSTSTNSNKNNNQNNTIENNEVAGNEQSNQDFSNTQANSNQENEVNENNNKGINDGKSKLSNEKIIEYSIFSVIGLIILILLVAVIIRELKQKKDEE